ncbi:two-component system, sensor histidine kinase YesM [Paenibacillus sp. yr247]|uniref:cache domain-containing sensor histidine kinase n=1 Tax=Paenibacillus sp. yr247 TaxID=1761880 RepID=UPI00088BB8E9|nr:sensor histidine kinase [Paenibacillus sp. yr247]SDO04291.1 two-component system, sensor histidine kinase YesM [Paenibacillus sp. yr247]
MKNMFKRYRIDYLLYGGLASFVVIFLAIVIGLTYTLSTQEMARMTSYYQQGQLSELYNKIEIQMRSIEQISLAASRNTTLSEYSDISEDAYSNYQKRVELDTFLANITYATPIIQSIEYYMKNAGHSQYQSLVAFIDEKQAKSQDWYALVDHTDFTWIGQHTITSLQGEVSVISFARKIYSNSGNYQGLLMLHVKASSIQNLMRGETPDSNRMLLDSGGRVITLIGDSSLQKKVKAYMPKMEGESGYLKSGPSIEGEPDADATKHFIVWARHFYANWTLVEFTPWNQITRGSVRIAEILSLVGISAIVIALFITLYVSSQLIKPIRLLVREMGGYSANGRTINLPNDYYNEFGVLFSGYRKLIDRIQALYLSLENQYKQQKNAEIKALQAMINPHFLYNTLDQLNWMALSTGQDKLSHILELMGRMFRIGLSNGESLITIREEFIHAECYLQIQQLRWEEGLMVTIDVPEHLKGWYIPKITLQPFIENAIMHGFNERTTGSINIKAQVEGEDIVISISDDGVGLKKNWDTMKKGNTGGYGIRNVRERFEAFFGDSYQIDIKNNDNASGTTVVIRFPKLKSKELEDWGRRLTRSQN